MEKRAGNSLPYIRGGPPGALYGLFAISAALSVLSSIGALISFFMSIGNGSVGRLFSNGYVIEGLFQLAAPVFSIFMTVLAFRLVIGARNLRSGMPGGADMAAKAYRGNLIILWIVLGCYLLIVMINIFRTGSSGSFLGFLLASAFSVLLILPAHYYLKNAERIMAHISSEDYSKRISMPYRTGDISGLSIVFGVLLLVAAGLSACGIIPLTDLYRGNYHYTELISQIVIWILYLGAARALLGNVCWLGFRRSHQIAWKSQENHRFRPAYYSTDSAFGVMGSILFGWLVLNSLITLMSILRYSSSSADQIARSAQPVAAYLFLGAATMRRKSRTLWTVLGSLVYMVSLVWTLVVLINQERFYRMNNLTAYVVFYYIYIGLFLLSFILFVSAAFIRCGMPVSRGLFNTLVTTVSAGILAFFIACILYYANYRYADIDASLVISLIIESVCLWFALFGLACAMREPHRGEFEDYMDYMEDEGNEENDATAKSFG